MRIDLENPTQANDLTFLLNIKGEAVTPDSRTVLVNQPRIPGGVRPLGLDVVYKDDIRPFFPEGYRNEVMGNFYISVGESATPGAATVRLWWHPLVGWIWGGALIMALGGVLSLSDRRMRLAMPAGKLKAAKATEAAA